MTGRLLSVEQVADLCGLSRRSVYRAVDAGELVAHRLRGRVRIPEVALESWLEAHRVSARQRPRPSAGLAPGLRRRANCGASCWPNLRVRPDPVGLHETNRRMASEGLRTRHRCLLDSLAYPGLPRRLPRVYNGAYEDRT